MPAQDPVDAFERITYRRAQVLGALADSLTEKEAAAALGVGESGIRSHVEALKEITGEDSVRGLGRWWRTHRQAWVEMMAQAAGVRISDSR